MSSTPLDLVDEYGADALRFTLTAMSGPARNIRLSKQRVEGYRNFGTKLWNAARFCQMNECVPDRRFRSGSAITGTLNRWLRGEVAKTASRSSPAPWSASRSMRRRARSTASSGTPSATGTWSWPSRS